MFIKYHNRTINLDKVSLVEESDYDGVCYIHLDGVEETLSLREDADFVSTVIAYSLAHGRRYEVDYLDVDAKLAEMRADIAKQKIKMSDFLPPQNVGRD